MSLNTILATAPLTATGYHLKATGTALGQSLIWDNGTNVGIGNQGTTYGLEVTGTVGISGITKVLSSTASTSTTTGGLVVTGGVGIGGALFGTSATFSSSVTADGLNLANSTNGYVGLRLEGTGTYAGSDWTIYASSTSPSSANDFIGFFNNSTTDGATADYKLRIFKNGNVGINCIPDTNSKLDVNGQAFVAHLAIYNNNGTPSLGTSPMLYSPASATLAISTGNTERMRITSTGYVWINGAISGYSGSSAQLQVNGGARTQSIRMHNEANVAQAVILSCNGADSFYVQGALSKNSGSFRIDHPLESMSETHQLVHSFIEAPQADLYYRGKMVLVNGKGQANIDEIATMTEGTFEALCREVQCFTTNESGWDLVKGKVIGNIIYIESQNTNSTDEISWMVIGERKDKHMMDTSWTDENGKVIVEPLKPIETKTN